MTLSYAQVEVETLEPLCYEVVFGWEAILAHYEGEALPRLYRKTKQGYRWQLWGIGELEWTHLNQHLASGEEVLVDLETIRKLLGLYRYAKDWGINTSGLLKPLHEMSQKDCPVYRVWLGDRLEWAVEEDLEEDRGEHMLYLGGELKRTIHTSQAPAVVDLLEIARSQV